jgi:hypothetical protein
MTEPVDPKTAAIEFTGYLKEVLQPPMEGASLGGILGAYIFKGVLRDAGYAIVPLTPTPEMVSAFKRNSFRPFSDRYDAMVRAAWPEGSERDEKQKSRKKPMFSWYKRRSYRHKALAAAKMLTDHFPSVYQSGYRRSKHEVAKIIDDAFEAQTNPYEVGLGIGAGFIEYFIVHHLTDQQRAECIAAWEEKREIPFVIAYRRMIQAAYGLVTTFGVDPLVMDAIVANVMDILKGVPPEQRKDRRIAEYLEHTDPDSMRRKNEYLRSLRP